MITLHSPTPSPDQSIDFYTRLGFKSISVNPIMFTDGKAVVEINPDRTARAGIKIYGISDVRQVEQFGKVTPISGGHLCSDPSGIWIYCMETASPVAFTPEQTSFGIVGNFMGITLETTDIERSIKFYEALGFTYGSGNAAHGYVSYMRDGAAVTLMKPLMCPHLFFNPSLTYFNGNKNPEIIEKIRSLHIPITEEITHFNKEGLVDNVILRDPGGVGFFVFND